jgi:pimeloyl-ACP methyl ester carboxylesterase
LEETAQALMERLRALGIGADDGKGLDLIAHSAGGLVARWFVEREGGAALVDRLTLVGTPNQGSPWPTIQDLATTALAIGLNSLAAVAWPVKVLGPLLKGVELADVTLDQMKGGSDFLQTLNGSDDPGIPYMLVAGNTAVIPAALEATGTEESPLRRLLGRLRAVDAAASLALLRQPNDLVVSVHSATALAGERAAGRQARVVGCDHFSYFASEAGTGILRAHQRIE